MYRIVQELTNNIIKHAGATQLTFKCTVQSDSLLASISHNGSGLSDDTFNEHVYKKNAIGLKNIVTRLKSVNGSISFDNNKNMAITNINYTIMSTIKYIIADDHAIFRQGIKYSIGTDDGLECVGAKQITERNY